MIKRTILLVCCLFFTVSLFATNDKEKTTLIDAKNKLINSKGIIEKLEDTFHKKVTLYNDEQEVAKGYDAITAYYTKKFSSEYEVNTVLSDRISFKSFQIDRERVVTSEGTLDRIAVYQFKKGKIFKIWFLSPNLSKPNAVPAVNELARGYRDSNLNDFMDALAPYIIECDFPGRCNVAGKRDMRERYQQYLGKHTTSYRVVKRIAIGDLVIDDNYISLYLKESRNIAIYQTDNKGKIKRIEFLGF